MLQPVAVPGPVFAIVAKAVAGAPTITDRLLGSTDDSSSAWAICPRISPSGNTEECTLTYQRPASRSAAWAGVNDSVPVFGLPAGKGKITGALTPGRAGPWMWAAVSPPSRPKTAML